MQVGLTIQEVQRDILLWDYHSLLYGTPGKGLKQLGLQRVPTQFNGLRDYCRTFRVLLLEEMKAHLVQVSLSAFMICQFITFHRFVTGITQFLSDSFSGVWLRLL